MEVRKTVDGRVSWLGWLVINIGPRGKLGHWWKLKDKTQGSHWSWWVCESLSQLVRWEWEAAMRKREREREREAPAALDSRTAAGKERTQEAVQSLSRSSLSQEQVIDDCNKLLSQLHLQLQQQPPGKVCPMRTVALLSLPLTLILILSSCKRASGPPGHLWTRTRREKERERERERERETHKTFATAPPNELGERTQHNTIHPHTHTIQASKLFNGQRMGDRRRKEVKRRLLCVRERREREREREEKRPQHARLS